MRNTLGDLNNHLFEQLERLNDEELEGEKLSEEINRAKSVGDIANKIIDNGKLVLDAQKFVNDSDKVNADTQVPRMLTGDKQ